MLYGIEKGVMNKIPLFYDVIFSCSFCGACELECPPGIKALELIEEARRKIALKGKPPFHGRMVEHLLDKGHPYAGPLNSAIQ